jgi:hypothetical protein
MAKRGRKSRLALGGLHTACDSHHENVKLCISALWHHSKEGLLVALVPRSQYHIPNYTVTGLSSWQTAPSLSCPCTMPFDRERHVTKPRPTQTEGRCTVWKYAVQFAALCGGRHRAHHNVIMAYSGAYFVNVQ